MRLLPTKPLGRLACGALALPAMILSSTAAQAASYPCFEDAAMQSARIHDLRMNLMVNSLKCRSIAPQTLSTYGRLLNSRADEFAAHGRAVKASFVERYGPRQGAVTFDDYETRLSNYHSGTQASRGSCEDTAAAIRLASRADHSELATLSRLVTNRGIRACAVEQESQTVALQAPATYPVVAPTTTTVQGPRMTADWPEAPAPAPRVEAADMLPAGAPAGVPVGSAPAPRMIDGVETYGPGQGPDTAPEPLEQLDPAPSVAAAPPASTEDREAALAQAIAALDAAATALRGMQEGAGGTK
ncbi:MAG: hypothetical protein AAF127_11425 [Pseudomonadota bacterium]